MITNFAGRAKKLDDVDLPRIGHEIGVGEDELHAFMDVETRGYGFDKKDRPVILFEPHVFWRQLPESKRAEARKAGLAHPKWGAINYARSSDGNYNRLKKAMAIDYEAALKSCSWGFSQVMGFNYAMIGYKSVEAMVRAFMDDEEIHIKAMVDFIVASGIDDEMRELAALTRPTRPEDCVAIVSVYNGSGFRKNRYHEKFADAHNKWRGIPDTPWSPDDDQPQVNDEPEKVHEEESEPETGQDAGKPKNAILRALKIFVQWLKNKMQKMKRKQSNV